jgi:hypothetical protein
LQDSPKRLEQTIEQIQRTDHQVHYENSDGFLPVLQFQNHLNDTNSESSRVCDDHWHCGYQKSVDKPEETVEEIKNRHPERQVFHPLGSPRFDNLRQHEEGAYGSRTVTDKIR